MELRRTFNEDERNYDRARPGYPAELFGDIFSYARVGAGSVAVEIGIGTGQATLPFLEQGCRVTAIELGDKLAAYAGEKFSAFDHFQVICGDFMEQDLPENSTDLIYSATAFHWLPQAAAYEKVLRILKPGGTLALFWNHPFSNRMDDPSNVASAAVYEAYRPSPKPILEFSEADCAPHLNVMQAAGFADVTARLYRRTRSLTTEEYLALLNTYSDHRALPDEIRLPFEREMREQLNRLGGEMRIYDTLDLYLAKKPG